MFDLRLLSASHFIFLLLSFVLSFGAIHRWRSQYAGFVPAAVTTILSFLILDNILLSLALALATILIMLVGRADEAHPLSAAAQLFWQLLISLILVLFGWTIPHVSNPFGPGVIELGALSLPLTIAWIILMMNAINWLDGMDGLASIVAIVAFLTLATVSVLPATQDATTLGLALVGAGALAGFFLHNAPPARVYLGTVGSWFVGIFLALTALVGGGKVATVTLVLALPVLDAFFVIIQRLFAGKRPWVGDKTHLHYRLATLGWKIPHIIFGAGVLTTALGVVAVTAQTQQKIWALVTVAILLAMVTVAVSYFSHVNKKTSRR